MIVGSRLAKNAVKSTKRRRISTGVAGTIRVIMAEKCGGAAASQARTNPAASLVSMSLKMMMTKKWKQTKKMIKTRARST